MSNERNLRIFCPIHEASFEVVDNAKIACEITGHSLSTGFPESECWEFCCNCETFSPSQLGKGERSRTTCYGCQNEISKRFACDQCKIFSFECSTLAKGKSYFVSASGIAPACPGCENPVIPSKVLEHDCKDIGVGFFTALETCPFCLEETGKAKKVSVNKSQSLCPQCSSITIHGSVFCEK